MPQDDDRLWFTRVEAAALCGLSSRQFDEVIRPLIKSGERGTSKTLRFHGPAIVAALLEYRQPKTPDDPDGLLGGGPDSPALERYRLARAKLAEWDVEERDKNVVRLAVMQDALRAGTGPMRATGERLTRLYGNEAGEIFNEGVAEFEAAALRAITQADGTGGSNIRRDEVDSDSGRRDADAAATNDR